MPSNACIELIKASEGFRAVPYRDVAGNETVGYGHKVTPLDSIPYPWTEAMATAVLCEDAQKACQEMLGLVKVVLSQGQCDALTDFVFNEGSGRLAGSTLLRLLDMGQYGTVPDQLAKWVYAAGVKQPGLEVRRQKEIDLWETV